MLETACSLCCAAMEESQRGNAGDRLPLMLRRDGGLAGLAHEDDGRGDLKLEDAPLVCWRMRNSARTMATRETQLRHFVRETYFLSRNFQLTNTHLTFWVSILDQPVADSLRRDWLAYKRSVARTWESRPRELGSSYVR